MKIAHEIYRAAVDGNFDIWRRHYSALGIDDLIWLNTALHHFYPKQAHYNILPISVLFKTINVEIKNIRVIELGCHQGSLAAQVLAIYPDINVWIGFDINFHAISAPAVIDKRYVGSKLNDWIYNIQSMPANVFVVSHTFEHMNGCQIGRTIRWAHDSGIEFIIIEMPFRDEWIGYRGSHIFEGPRDDFMEIVEGNGYKLFSEQTQTIFALRRIEIWKPEKKRDTTI